MDKKLALLLVDLFEFALRNHFAIVRMADRGLFPIEDLNLVQFEAAETIRPLRERFEHSSDEEIPGILAGIDLMGKFKGMGESDDRPSDPLKPSSRENAPSPESGIS